MGQLQEVEAEIVELGYQLLFVSPDKPETIQAAMKKQDYHYTLLSDSQLAAAKAFGVAWQAGDEMIARYKEHGLDLEAAAGETHHQLPVPAVFIVNKKGQVRFEYVDPNYRARIDPSVLLAAARAEAGS